VGDYGIRDGGKGFRGRATSGQRTCKEKEELVFFSKQTEALEKASKGVVTDNTKQSTRWALNTFLTWIIERNKRWPDLRIEIDVFIVLSCTDPEHVCYVLLLFVIEEHKVNGIHLLL
jgi:hypothetical protein